MTELLKSAFPIALLSVAMQMQAAETLLRFVSQKGSRVVIEGSNNVHEWQIKGDVIDGVLECGPSFPVSTNQRVRLGDVRGQMEGSIPVRSLHHDAKAMDRTVYQALKEGRNPRISFRFDDLTLTRRPTTNEAAFLLDADRELVVAGVTNLSRVPLSVEPLGNNRLRISGAMTLTMSDFGIKPPEGKGADFTIKTRDEVHIRFDWLLAPEPTAAPDSTLPVPPFLVEGSIISSNHFSTTDAKFSFFSSNGWWQINLTNFTSPQSYHCMSIPGGVRWYVVFPHQTNLPAGTAAPITFPPPGIAGGMFQTWLCLCPRPQLPLIDDKMTSGCETKFFG